jgi:hypothetical protein
MTKSGPPVLGREAALHLDERNDLGEPLQPQ